MRWPPAPIRVSGGGGASPAEPGLGLGLVTPTAPQGDGDLGGCSRGKSVCPTGSAGCRVGRMLAPPGRPERVLTPAARAQESPGCLPSCRAAAAPEP